MFFILAAGVVVVVVGVDNDVTVPTPPKYDDDDDKANTDTARDVYQVLFLVAVMVILLLRRADCNAATFMVFRDLSKGYCILLFVYFTLMYHACAVRMLLYKIVMKLKI